MRFAGIVSFNITQVARVSFSCVRSTVMLMSGVEMATGGSGIRRRTVVLFVDVKTVFARTEVLKIANYSHVVSGLGESDGAAHLAARLRLKFHRRFGRFLRSKTA